MATINEAMTQAVEQHRAGNLRQAEHIYKQVLEADPTNPDALHFLGFVAYQLGQQAMAIDCMRRALAHQPDRANCHADLARVYQALQQWDRCVASAREALRVNPRHTAALNTLGIAFSNQRQWDEAANLFQKVTQLQPDSVDAHINLGNVLTEKGLLDDAVNAYRAALRLQADCSEALCNLGNALRKQGKFEDAVSHIERAIAAHPDYWEAHNNLGLLLKEMGKLTESCTVLRGALAIRPQSVAALTNLGLTLDALGSREEAMALFGRALELRPDSIEAAIALAFTLNKQGRFDVAVAGLRRTLERCPDSPGLHNALGTLFACRRLHGDAAVSYRRALELRPDFPDALKNLGNMRREQRKLDEALATLRRALEYWPRFAEAHNDIGNVFKDLGLLDEALAAFRRAVDLQPDSSLFHSNLAFALHYHPDTTTSELRAEHDRWNARHAAPLPRLDQHARDANPNRRVRVGYVSPDLRHHPVGLFLLPLFEAHDHEHWEITCYSSYAGPPDEHTRKLRACCDHWRDVAALTDAQLAELIRSDAIDILVDLAVHTADNRLLAFARKPAPVQVTYLGYCSTTGMPAIDYRLTDPYLDAEEGRGKSYYAEESVWLPETYWCYRPYLDLPEPGPLPALKTARIAFGCLNNFCKVTPPALAAWRQLLQQLPRARLLLRAPAGSPRERILAFFADGDVVVDRIEFVGVGALADYFRLYDRIDLALDPFPYGGVTTTCDALWMGVPVISLAGRTPIARSGLSLLSNVGLPELVGHTVDDYVCIAAELAGDLPRLANLRAGLRQRMRQSPLTDAPRFAASVEVAYRTMWQRWCEKR